MQCVVGANGFLGSALVRRLEAEGVQPLRITRSQPWSRGRGEYERGQDAADAVYWVAGSVNPATADANPERIAADLRALSSFADAVNASPIRRVVFASSGGTVYDITKPPPYAEAHATRPSSTYGSYKLHQEQLLDQMLPEEVELVVLRIGNAYGPGQPVGTGQGVVAYWLDAAAAGRPLTLFGEPTTTRDFTFIDDVTSALVHFAHVELDSTREVFNISSGKQTRLGDLASTIMDVVGAPELRLDMRPARPFDVPHIWLDTSRAAAAGWRATTSLETGIERSWAAVRRRAAAPV